MNINEHLAVNVIGAEFHGDENGGYYIFGDMPLGKRVCSLKDWDPRENIDQAFLCLDTFDWCRIDRTSGTHYVTIYQGKGFEAENILLSRAICQAIAKATGYDI